VKTRQLCELPHSQNKKSGLFGSANTFAKGAALNITDTALGLGD
jgi:hypothetical protein